jgi:hypothetical protein
MERSAQTVACTVSFDTDKYQSFDTDNYQSFDTDKYQSTNSL